MFTPTHPLSRMEFIALMAMMSAATAFSIDAMLPALGQITADLRPVDPNSTQLIITSFVLGLGIGTLFSGPMSDSFGRRPVILWSSLIYALSCAAAYWAQSLEAVLAWRVAAGLAAAGPRVCVMAIIRDRYEGRGMARVVSFVMMVFTLVPAVAPMVGAGVIYLSDWRGIFVAFVIFALVYASWFGLRQPETLPPERRRPLRIAPLWAATREVLSNRSALTAILALACAFGILFGTISSVQPIFDQTFGRADSLIYWWAIIAVLAGGASVLNARIVMRLGMVRIVGVVMAVEMGLSLALSGLWLVAPEAFFAPFLLWQWSVFALGGLCIGNLNALALQPMGHIAGLAASVITALATVLGVVIAAPLGLAFDGTPLPLMLGVGAAAGVAALLMRSLPSEAREA